MKKHTLFTLIIAMLLSIALATVALAEKPPGISKDPVDKSSISAMSDLIDLQSQANYVAPQPFAGASPPGLKSQTIIAEHMSSILCTQLARLSSPDIMGGSRGNKVHFISSTETWHKIRGTPA